MKTGDAIQKLKAQVARGKHGEEPFAGNLAFFRKHLAAHERELIHDQDQAVAASR